MFADNAKKSRFEYTVDSSVAFANYRREGTMLYIDYVEAPVELRGTGAAGKLMQEIMDFSKNNSLKVVPICGYAAAWMSHHNF